MNDRNFEAGAELVLAYKTWNTSEIQRQKERGDGIEIIDFDLVPYSFLKKTLPQRRITKINGECRTREGALDFLRGLGNSFDDSTLDGQFMLSRIIASNEFTRAIQHPNAIFPLNSYLEATLGLEEGSRIGTELISDDVIEDRRDGVERLFNDLGYSFDREGWAKFINDNQTTPQSAYAEFKTAEPRLTSIVMETLGLTEIPDYETEFTQENAYWMAWAKGTPERKLLRLNTHPRVMHRWSAGVAERLILHEICGHMFQASAWQKNVLEGKINPGYGITVIPGPEQWHSEGFADALHRFFPDVFTAMSPAGKFAAEYSLLTDMVKRNAHIGANTDPERREQIIARILDVLPSETRETVTVDLLERLKEPRTRAYLIAYGGSYDHTIYAANLPTYQREQLLLEIYHHPMTPSQIQVRFEQLLAARYRPAVPSPKRIKEVFKGLVGHNARNHHIVNPT